MSATACNSSGEAAFPFITMLLQYIEKLIISPWYIIWSKFLLFWLVEKQNRSHRLFKLGKNRKCLELVDQSKLEEQSSYRKIARRALSYCARFAHDNFNWP